MKMDKETANGITRIMKLAKELGTKSVKIGELEIVFDSHSQLPENRTKSGLGDEQTKSDIEFDFGEGGKPVADVNQIQRELRMISDPEAWERELLDENQEAQDFGARPTL